MSPSISVIIPAYRAVKTIGRAVDSLLTQTRPPDEILIVDDGSPDDLGSALAHYRERVTVIRQSNTGASGARNRGIDAARGELIAFLDADDYWEPMKLQCQLDILARHPEVGVVASQYFIQDPGCSKLLPPRDNACFYDCVLRAPADRMLEITMRLWTSTVMIRRSAIGQRRFDLHLKAAEDHDLWIRLLADYPVYILSKPLATMVFESESLSRSNPDEGYSPLVEVVKRYSHLVTRGSRRRFESRLYRGWASAYLSRGHPCAAIRPAWHRLCRQPFSAEAWWVVGKSFALACMGSSRSPAESTANAVG